eukprot:TRINITY_DN5270_c0_g1_i4.p2 TRINITY_DN5270_c0_g1~~TRINITY_DN5270_c0_g1_i4.p2  ORF type:complete len:487 (-),score=137.79 TRINITY_DN5270_c0_g1_i4:1890-3350(-)
MQILPKSQKGDDDYRYCENFINFYFKDSIHEERLYLDNNVMKQLSDNIVFKKFLKGTPLTNENDTRKVYFIVEGTLNRLDASSEKVVQSLKKGKVANFSHITDKPSLVAGDDLEVLEIDAGKYNQIKESNRVTSDKKFDFLSKHFVNFKRLGASEREERMKFFTSEEIEPYKLVIKPETKAEGFFCVLSGKVASFVVKKEGNETTYLIVEILNPGDCFNESYFLFEKPSRCGFVTVDKCNIIKLTKDQLPLVSDSEAENHMRGNSLVKDRFLTEKLRRLTSLNAEQLKKQQADYCERQSVDLFKLREMLVKLLNKPDEKQKIIDSLRRPINAKGEEKSIEPPIAGLGVTLRPLPNRDEPRKQLVEATPRLVSRTLNPEAVLGRQRLENISKALRGEQVVGENRKISQMSLNAKGVGAKLAEEDDALPQKKAIGEKRVDIEQNLKKEEDAKNATKNILQMFAKDNSTLLQKLGTKDDKPAESSKEQE